MIETCEREKIDLLLIAGDLFHRQPLLRELKEVSYLFGKLTKTQVILVAGNHDYIKKDSYYRTFHWQKHVHMISADEPQCIELPEISTSVCGFSYHSREIRERLDISRLKKGRQKYEILLLHGGDETHVPFNREDLRRVDYDYVALGHIHKPQTVIDGKAAYSGALEPIDKNDTGKHGFIKGEITGEGCRIRFVPASVRHYIHEKITVTPQFTDQELQERIEACIREQGEQHFYKFILTGFRDPDIMFETVRRFSPGDSLYGHPAFGNEHGWNILEIADRTTPTYDFEQLMKQHKEDILGAFIEELSEYPQESIQYRALCEGVQALMDTRRG